MTNDEQVLEILVCHIQVVQGLSSYKTTDLATPKSLSKPASKKTMTLENLHGSIGNTSSFTSFMVDFPTSS